MRHASSLRLLTAFAPAVAFAAGTLLPTALGQSKPKKGAPAVTPVSPSDVDGRGFGS